MTLAIPLLALAAVEVYRAHQSRSIGLPWVDQAIAAAGCLALAVIAWRMM